MSKLTSTIIPAIADLDLAVNGEPARTAYGGTIPNSAESASLPLRVLSPYNDRQQGKLIRRTTLAGNRVIDWTIEDLLLARETGTGTGPGDLSDALQSYQEDYEAELGDLKATQWTLTESEFHPGVYEWPEGSGRQYDGVRCLHTVRELR